MRHDTSDIGARGGQRWQQTGLDGIVNPDKDDRDQARGLDSRTRGLAPDGDDDVRVVVDDFLGTAAGSRLAWAGIQELNTQSLALGQAAGLHGVAHGVAHGGSRLLGTRGEDRDKFLLCRGREGQHCKKRQQRREQGAKSKH